MKIVIASDAKQPNETYRGALLAAGALPEEVVVVCPGDADPGAFDGLLLAGGRDIDPARYGETPQAPELELHPERDTLDFALFAAAEKLRAPVFGICRGLQVVNVALGGTLWQDLPAQRPRGFAHDADSDPPVAHVVRARPGASRSRFSAAIAGLDGASVNSRHHQGVKDLAPGLAALAASPDDLVEALERPTGAFLACVQWHPENLVNERTQKAVFEAFLDASRAHAREKQLNDRPQTTGDSMNRSLSFRTARLASLAFALVGSSAFAVEAPRPKAPERPPFEVAKPIANENFWVGVFGSTNCSWIDTGDGVLVIDTGATAVDAKNLKAEIARTTKNKPIRWIAMTHLHADSNDGFTTFLPTDATIFVNARATGTIAGAIAGGSGKAPTIVGVSDRVALVAGRRAFEIGIPAGNAHSAYDLYVFDPATRTVFTGDLVTADRCPMLSDPDSDLKGWLAALDRLDTLGAQGFVPTRGLARLGAAPEIDTTRRYIKSMLAFLTEKKKQNAPEARVSGELAAEKLSDYCPRELSAINALS
ncbi:MAG: gamma-glutamyl-gamma-aminobutyrate hydrolase family protein, partial [Acidobacteriota bacterium]|nr:gamma-glutamyl-gamma-aminobutyrate hydrolase family protein [Acidobacteriota bacterium]